jgi:hypothetical protein
LFETPDEMADNAFVFTKEQAAMSASDVVDGVDRVGVMPDREAIVCWNNLFRDMGLTDEADQKAAIAAVLWFFMSNSTSPKQEFAEQVEIDGERYTMREVLLKMRLPDVRVRRFARAPVNMKIMNVMCDVPEYRMLLEEKADSYAIQRSCYRAVIDVAQYFPGLTLAEQAAMTTVGKKRKSPQDEVKIVREDMTAPDYNGDRSMSEHVNF